MRRQRLLATALLAIGMATKPASAFACTCVGFPTFDEFAREREIVSVVRAIQQGVPETTIEGADHVAYIDAEIVRVVRAGGSRVACVSGTMDLGGTVLLSSRLYGGAHSP